MTGAEPIRPNDRHEIIDIIRGFALFGVLISNLTWTVLHAGVPGELLDQLPTAGIDVVVDLSVLTFVQAKFYTLFSMLFGLGLAIQFESAKRKGRPLAPTYLRRLSLLFVFGALHATLLWFGDILHLYAINGVVLLFLTRFPVRVLLRMTAVLAVFVFFMPTLAWLTDAPGGNLSPVESVETEALIDPVPDAEPEVDPRYLAMSEGSYVDIVRMNTQAAREDYDNLHLGGDDSIIYWYLSVLWKFILGFCIGRLAILQNLSDHRATMRRWFPRTLLIGLAGNAIFTGHLILTENWLPSMRTPEALLVVFVEIGIVSLSFAYAIGLCLLIQRPKPPRWLLALAPVGRMALTNYLTQSFLYVILFYGLGFGLVGHVGASSVVAIGIAIYVAQIALSGWWLQRYQFGPFEWLWRSMTYGKRQPMRRPV